MNKVAASLTALCLASLATAQAQEPVRPSIARQVSQTTLPVLYNIKAGPVLFRVNATLRADYVDNVNLGNGSTTPREPDFILNPALGLDVAWTITKLNTLRLHTSIGYTKYFSHSELDSSAVIVSPDSQLSLDIYTGDFKINLHEQFSYQQDPVGQGAVGNVEKFGRFTNVAGVQVFWDLNAVILTLGYDHTNFVTTGATSSTGAQVDTSALNYASDQLSASAFFHFSNVLGGGIETTVSSTRYSNNSLNDATRFSAGPFLEAQLTRYTKASVSGGFQGTYFANINAAANATVVTSSSTLVTVPQNRSGDSNSYYANLTLSNRLNRYYSSQLSVGHESQVGLLSEQADTNYVNYSSNLQLFPQIAIGTSIAFSDTTDSGAFVLGASGPVGSSHYQLLTISVGSNYQITKKLNASLGYQFNERVSDELPGVPDQSYTQNRIILTLGYQF